MDAFCEDLRRERERQGISLEAVSQTTKISQRHLRALEAGDLASLPGGVFRKGILRSYLSTLNVDPAPWVQRFEGCLAGMSGAGDSPEVLAEFAENIRRGRGTAVREPIRWPGVFVMLMLLLAFGWCVWHFALHGRVVLTQGTLPAAAPMSHLPPA